LTGLAVHHRKTLPVQAGAPVRFGGLVIVRLEGRERTVVDALCANEAAVRKCSEAAKLTIFVPTKWA
jgi:hypothetical protein